MDFMIFVMFGFIPPTSLGRFVKSCKISPGLAFSGHTPIKKFFSASSCPDLEIIESDNVIVKCNNMVYESSLYGDYNFSNVCSAIAIGLEFGIDPKLIHEKLKNFSSNNNRSEIIKINNKNVILDAYNANPTSVEFAIKSFIKNKGTKALVLGDMFELGENSEIEHKKIIDIADEFNIDRCIFIGEEFFKLKQDSVKNIFFKIYIC